MSAKPYMANMAQNKIQEVWLAMRLRCLSTDLATWGLQSLNSFPYLVRWAPGHHRQHRPRECPALGAPSCPKRAGAGQGLRARMHNEPRSWCTDPWHPYREHTCRFYSSGGDIDVPCLRLCDVGMGIYRRNVKSEVHL